jgi:Holliday junction resolvasome RuvABC DNA-binding subunit
LPVPASAELRAKTYRALVSLGFRDSEAKQALARLPANSSQNGSSSVDLASFEVLLRAALRELAPNRH